MSAKYYDFLLSGDPVAARATVEQALIARKFSIGWQDEWTGVAERGSKVANAFVGALAQYFKVGVRVTSEESGQIVVRIERLSSGAMGGIIGASRTSSNMRELSGQLQAAFSAAGVLQGVREQ